MARVFAGDLIDLLQDAQRPKRDVFEISDRRADKIEAAAGCRIRRICRLGGSSPRAHDQESSTRSDGVSHACYTLSFEQYLRGASVPLYEYKCFEVRPQHGKNRERFGPHLKKCPHCGGKVESVITAPAIQFKGAGWYVNDYGGKKATSGDGEKADKPITEATEAGTKDKESASREAHPKIPKIPKIPRRAKKRSPQEKIVLLERDAALTV